MTERSHVREEMVSMTIVSVGGDQKTRETATTTTIEVRLLAVEITTPTTENNQVAKRKTITTTTIHRNGLGVMVDLGATMGLLNMARNLSQQFAEGTLILRNDHRGAEMILTQRMTTHLHDGTVVRKTSNDRLGVKTTIGTMNQTAVTSESADKKSTTAIATPGAVTAAANGTQTPSLKMITTGAVTAIGGRQKTVAPSRQRR